MLVLVLSSPMSLMKRLSMSGKKSSSGKMSSWWASVMKPVVAQSAPPKPYRPSPVQDSKQRGSGGLLSRSVVHATGRDGEELGSAVLWNLWQEMVLCYMSN
jgi:hypothetical protein